MKSLAVILTLLAFFWTTVADHEHDLQYYEAHVVITNAADEVATRGVVSGAYATVATACNMTNCGVKSSKYNCNGLPLEDFITANCYIITCDSVTSCGEIVPGSVATATAPSGIIIPARDITLRIKRLAIRTATADRISFPVIIIHHKDAFLLSSTGVIFSVNIGDEQFISPSNPVITNHNTHTEQSHNIAKAPLYYATLFIIVPMFIFIILIFLVSAGMAVIWMCRKCTIKVLMFVYMYS